MARNELLARLNILFPGFSTHVENKGLAQVNKTFCLLLTMGLHQQGEILKRKAERMKEANKYRYELLYRLEALWRKLDLICALIQSIEYDVIDGVEITDAMLERTYNHFSALKMNTDYIIGLLRTLSKAENVEPLCPEIEKAVDDLEQAVTAK